MKVVPNDALPIEGQQLTAWAVLPGGAQLRLDFMAADGKTHRIVLPFDALSGLLMTLPRMLQSALDERFSDGSLRLVQRLGNWRLEHMEGDVGVILKLGTKDGFEVAFALDNEHVGSIGAALLGTPQDNNQVEVRRPN